MTIGRSAVLGYGGADTTRQKFTSKERDSESGLDYFIARYYSGAQGRFTSVDPENAGANPSDAQSWNGYAYARNNPLIYVDPTGKDYDLYDKDGELLGRVKDATDLDKLGYTAYGGNDDGSLLYFKDGDGNLFTAQYVEGDPGGVKVQAGYNISPLADRVFAELDRRSDASLKLIGGFAIVTYGTGAIAGGVASGIGGAAITQLGIRYGTEAWRVITASRPLEKMGHAAKHYSKFLRYANLTKQEVAKILEYVRQTGTQVGTGPHGEKIVEKVVEIGSNQVTVRVAESAGGVIKTGFPVP